MCSDYSGALTSRRKICSCGIVHASRPTLDPSDEKWLLRRAVGLIDVIQDAEVETLVAGNAAHLLYQGLVARLRAGEDPEARTVDPGARPAAVLPGSGWLAAGDQRVALRLVVGEDPVVPGRDSVHGWQEAWANLEFCRVRRIGAFCAEEASAVTDLATLILRIVVDLHRVACERGLGENLVLGV